jgi:hypothetical protein
MKNYLLLFIFPLFISCSHKTYVLYYEKEEVSRPLALNANDFWTLNLDSVSVINRQEIIGIDRLLKKMAYDKGDFSVSYSLILKKRHSQNDTMYADYFFKYWKRNNINYEDESEKLRVLLFPYLNRLK